MPIAPQPRPTPTKKGKSKRSTQPAPIKPTPEWIARYGEHQISPTDAAGFKMGRAYLREPWFESLVRRDWTDAAREKRAPAFTVDDLHALRRYRTCHEAALRSETRSSLNLERGGSSERGDVPPALARARREIAIMETWIGPAVETIRAIAIDDMSYAQVAMARFGYREVDIYDDATGTFRTRTSPRSGRHPTRIREEFQDGVRRLTSRGAWPDRPAEPLTATPRAPAPDTIATEAPVPPTVRGAIDAALDRAEQAATPIVAIAMSATVSDAIVREFGSDGVLDIYRGVPVTIRTDWLFGWVLVEG